MRNATVRTKYKSALCIEQILLSDVTWLRAFNYPTYFYSILAHVTAQFTVHSNFRNDVPCNVLISIALDVWLSLCFNRKTPSGRSSAPEMGSARLTPRAGRAADFAGANYLQFGLLDHSVLFKLSSINYSSM